MQLRMDVKMATHINVCSWTALRVKERFWAGACLKSRCCVEINVIMGWAGMSRGMHTARNGVGHTAR